MHYSLSGNAFVLAFLAFCYLMGTSILARLQLLGETTDTTINPLLAVPEPEKAPGRRLFFRD